MLIKTVLVTRPKNQAGSFVSQLKEHDLASVVFPTIEINALKDWEVPDISAFDGIFHQSQQRWFIYGPTREHSPRPA